MNDGALRAKTQKKLPKTQWLLYVGCLRHDHERGEHCIYLKSRCYDACRRATIKIRKYEVELTSNIW